MRAPAVSGAMRPNAVDLAIFANFADLTTSRLRIFLGFDQSEPSISQTATVMGTASAGQEIDRIGHGERPDGAGGQRDQAAAPAGGVDDPAGDRCGEREHLGSRGGDLFYRAIG